MDVFRDAVYDEFRLMIFLIFAVRAVPVVLVTQGDRLAAYFAMGLPDKIDLHAIGPGERICHDSFLVHLRNEEY